MKPAAPEQDQAERVPASALDQRRAKVSGVNHRVKPGVKSLSRPPLALILAASSSKQFISQLSRAPASPPTPHQSKVSDSTSRFGMAALRCSRCDCAMSECLDDSKGQQNNSCPRSAVPQTSARPTCLSFHAGADMVPRMPLNQTGVDPSPLAEP